MAKGKRKSTMVENASLVVDASAGPPVTEPVKKKKKRTPKLPKEGLAEEVAKFVQELAEEAQEVGESWATEEASAVVSREKRTKKSEPVACNPAEEEAEILESSEEELRVVKKKKKKPKKNNEAKTVSLESKAKAPRVAAEQDSGPKKESQRDDCKIYLGNLPWSANEDTLRSDFAKFGEIDKLRVPLDERGKHTGCAYIHYKSKETVEKVLLLDDIEYKGRKIKVKRRSPRRRAGRRQRHLRHQEE